MSVCVPVSVCLYVCIFVCVRSLCVYVCICMCLGSLCIYVCVCMCVHLCVLTLRPAPNHQMLTLGQALGCAFATAAPSALKHTWRQVLSLPHSTDEKVEVRGVNILSWDSVSSSLHKKKYPTLANWQAGNL